MKTSRPTISVIVPVYNVEKVLHRCIESILNQSYQYFELLLIDDGSSDSSGDICKQYAIKDSRIRVFRQKNAGVSSARNYGLSEAIGEYLCFVDSDDWVDLNFFSLLSGSLQKFDMAFFGGQIEKSSGELIEVMCPEFLQTGSLPLSEIVFSLFRDGILGYMCFMAIRSDIVRMNHIRFREDISIHEDSIFCYECLYKASAIVSLNIHSYHYVNYADEKLTLSTRIPNNYSCIAVERIREMERLLTTLQMPSDKKEYILNNMKYWAWGKCLDWASSQPQPVVSARFIIRQLSTIQDFSIPSIKGFLLSRLIRIGNPYALLFCKRMIKRLNVKKLSL